MKPKKFQLVTLILVLPYSLALNAPSEKVLTFASLLSARWSNSGQIHEETNYEAHPEHDKVTLLFKPVDVSFLEPNVTIFFKETVNGKWLRNFIFVLGEDAQNEIQIKEYNPNKEILESDVPNLTEEDLTPSDDCTAYFQQYGPTTFSGTWPSCILSNEPAGPRYAITVTCEHFSATLDEPDFPERQSHLPYDFHVNQRFLLLQNSLQGAVDFQYPCKQNQSTQ